MESSAKAVRQFVRRDSASALRKLGVERIRDCTWADHVNWNLTNRFRRSRPTSSFFHKGLCNILEGRNTLARQPGTAGPKGSGNRQLVHTPSMFHEFFLRGPRARIAWAWFGLASIMGKAVFSAWNKRRYNDFTLDFYNMVAYGQEYGLGHEQMVDRLYSIMWSWLSIQMAQFLVYPVLRILHNYWAASWRFVLVEEYLQRWHRNSRPLEGVSQRIHEDAHRFTEGINWITYDLLDSIASLMAFTPLLAMLGEKVPPPGFGKGEVPGVWLACAAVGGGIVGTCISLFIGRHLVAIRVTIQRLNAKLRRDLVLVESAYEHVAGADPDEYSTKRSCRASRLAPFAPLLTEMWNAYSTMYAHLGALRFWNELWSNVDELLPYILVAPRLIAADPEMRLSYGDLAQIKNAVGRVFNQIWTWAEKWEDLTEWMSVHRRLHELEEMLANADDREALAALATPTPSFGKVFGHALPFKALSSAVPVARSASSSPTAVIPSSSFRGVRSEPFRMADMV